MMNLVQKSLLRSSLVVLTLMLGAYPHAHAQGGCATGGVGCGSAPSAPEIDPSLGTGAIALLGGVVLLVRSRRKQ